MNNKVRVDKNAICLHSLSYMLHCMQTFGFLISQGSVSTFQMWVGQCRMGVANFMRFPAVQKFGKSIKIWESYKEFKGGNFFETQCRVIAHLCSIKTSAVHCLILSRSTRVADRQTDGQNYVSQDRASLAASCDKNWKTKKLQTVNWNNRKEHSYPILAPMIEHIVSALASQAYVLCVFS